MAQPQTLNLAGNIPPEYLQQQQQLNRQQQMAQLLMQQGQSMPSGQMVSGRYVAPSFFQYAAPLLQTYAGMKLAEKTEKQLAEEYKKLGEEKKAESERLAKALRGQETITEMAGPYGQGVGMGGANVPMPTATMQGQPDFRGAVETIMQNRLGTGREMLPTILERAMPKPNTPTTEIQNYQFMKESGQLPKGMTFLGYQTYLKELGKTTEKAPSGYRFMADGSLEPIKGGPADAKSQAKFAGRENVDTLITGLRDQYNILLNNEGITSTQAGFIPNLRSAASRSAVGQAIGQSVGSTNQSARNTIAQSRPLLLNAIKDATGMSAKQMDSNAELKMYLAAATDPSLDFESNMNALSQLEKLFGTPAENQGQGTSKTPTGQQKEVDFNSLPKSPARK